MSQLLSLFFLLVASQTSLAQDITGPKLPISALVVVSFPYGSSYFRPNAEQKEKLSAITNASMITVNGRTSTNTPSARDEALALARAVSARAWLVKHGVSPLKIMINYVSSGDFVADNSTPEGQRENQRVEIEAIYVPTY